MMGQTSTIDYATGFLQSEVGVFLQLKTKLQEMSRSPVLTISDSANNLLVNQNQLETELPGAVSKSQTGDISDFISASGFFVLMEKQIHDVNSLTDDYNALGSSAKPSLLSGIPTWALLAAGGLGLLYFIRR